MNLAEPSILSETESWAIVFKPHGMPTAPLPGKEQGTLLLWFLSQRPEAAGVYGKKEIEHGLLHRLDTNTCGLVLIAKQQHAFDGLSMAQQAGRIKKTYHAFCSAENNIELPGDGRYPFVITSQFRAYGPGRKEVRPLYPGMRGYKKGAGSYTTIIESATPFSDSQVLSVTCAIKRGYRHQIRAHLAHIGYPIIGDSLYNPLFRSGSAVADASIPLQLYAIGLTFPDPDSGEQVSFSLPQPDKMTR